MKIKRINIKNGYKRFHDLTIELGENPKRIIALVGPNGCGKSSVFDGMLYHANSHASIGNTGAKDHFYHSMTSTPGINYQSIDIDFLEGKYREVRHKKSQAGHENTVFSFRSPYRYNSNLKINASIATKEIRLNSYGASNCSDIDQKMEENYRRLNALYNRKMHDEDLRPTEAKQAILGELNTSLGNCLEIKIDDLGNIDEGRGTLYFSKPDQPVSFEFNVLSSGEKEVVDVILDLYLRRDVYNDTVFLIDEPELHINTSIQKNLLIEINKLVGDNCQIWISTHSIGFLRALQTELREECSVISFKKDDKYASESYTLSPMYPSIQAWKELFAVPLDDLAHLVCPEKIIYCEGKDKPTRSGQERGLDAQFYNTIFSSKYPNTLFVSSGGNTELDQRSTIAISILSKVVQDLDVLVLKDRDVGSGEYMTDTDRDRYLKTNEDNHRMLKRLEVENYAFDKEVVKAYCAAHEVDFDEATYDQYIPDIVNGDVKGIVGVIKNICEIKGSISPDKFKLTLAEFITEDTEVFAELESCAL